MYKVYLDEQPELESVLREFMADLDLCFDFGYGCYGDCEPQPLECRSRGGFIAHSHNCGGFDVTYMTDMRMLWGSGYTIGTIGDEEISEELSTCYEAFQYDHKNGLINIPEEHQSDYHWLYDNGHEDIAEALSEYENSWLSEETIHYGVRAMYEGRSGIWHTLCIYTGLNQSQYYHAFSNGSTTLGTYEVKFRNATELKEKLYKIKEKIESDF